MPSWALLQGVGLRVVKGFELRYREKQCQASSRGGVLRGGQTLLPRGPQQAPLAYLCGGHPVASLRRPHFFSHSPQCCGKVGTHYLFSSRSGERESSFLEPVRVFSALQTTSFRPMSVSRGSKPCGRRKMRQVGGGVFHLVLLGSAPLGPWSREGQPTCLDC